MDWDRLREEITRLASEVGDLLREVPEGSTRVPRLTWSVGELGAHLVSLPPRYRRMMNEPVPFPNHLSVMNETEITAVGETDPRKLAEMLGSEIAELLDLFGDEGDRAVPFFAMDHTVGGVGGVLLGELLLHGLDLAQVVKRPWPIRRDQALAVVSGLLPSLPHLALNDDVVERATGTYHVLLRGGDDWTVRVWDRQAVIERARPDRADLHVSADPVAYLLVGYGRMSRWKAVLSGTMIAWGRKPWLAAPFGKLFVET